MASSTGASLQEKLIKTLECSICLERLTDPKVLNCTHTYCKTCLDEILVFQDNGVAVITCPLRCEGQTIIGRDMTTNDLKASLQFKNLMDMLATEVSNDGDVKGKYKCDGFEGCGRSPSLYCPTCTAKLCVQCRQTHGHGSSPTSYVAIKIVGGDPHPWCSKHATIAAYFCQEDGFICIYCKHRDHAEHVYDQVAALSGQIKEWVINQEGNASSPETIQNIKLLTEDEFLDIKDKLAVTIKKRKLTCLAEYIKFLDTEEERMYNDVDSIRESHFKGYPSAHVRDHVRDKAPFEIYLGRESIMQKVGRMTANNTVIPAVNVSLSDDYSKELHPMGKVVGLPVEGIRLTDNTVVATVSSSVADQINDDVEASVVQAVEGFIQKAIGTKKKERASSSGESGIRGVSTDIQGYRVEKRTVKRQVDIPCYAWTEGEPTFYFTEEEVEEIVPYERSYGSEHKIQNAVSELDRKGCRYLLDLCKSKNEDLIIELMKVRTKTVAESRDRDGYSILHWTASCGCVKAMLYILQYEVVHVDITSRCNITPLHRAAIDNTRGCVEVLLAYGANVHVKTDTGKSALDLARERNHLDIIEILRDAQNPK